MSLRNPVKYPVKYYSWQDNQAPQLSNTDGAIKTILKACLVTGYGTKQGAGWTSLFEDDYRIVLRRPLRTGNPPDIKIENGVINGTASHRIVAQDNPAGLNDATELSSTNILARDSGAKKEWHCIVTDFAFLLCYQMGYPTGDKNQLWYVGSMQNFIDANADYFVCSYQSDMSRDNINAIYTYPFLDTNVIIKNLRTSATTTSKKILSLDFNEKYINNDYFAQKIIINDNATCPFFVALGYKDQDAVSTATSTVSIAGRPCLRWMNRTSYNPSGVNRLIYIPLDYWEL